jgi:acyl-CoA synthetase (NDP forming)
MSEPRRSSMDVVEDFAPLFTPATVAVVGASSTGVNLGNEFIRHCRAFGYRGRTIPVHPSAAEIEGLPCARGFDEIDGTVDYAYIALAADRVADVLAGAAGKLRFAQVISSGFGEIEAGRELESRLLRVARASGIRILGPNCLGVHCPRSGVTFVGQAWNEAGSIGVVSQSGGLAVDIILRGQQRGLRYSGLVTIGNSVDVGPAELLGYFNADTTTSVIGLYLEDVGDGRKFFDALKSGAARKPVVLLIGGQTLQGRRAAASHTGSLASDLGLWEGLARQTGCIITATLDEFLDALLVFQSLGTGHAHATRDVVLFGNGGGTSVLATDAFARAGLDVSPMSKEAQAALDALKLPPGTSIVNPIDTPAATLRQENGRVAERILDAVYTLAAPQSLVMHINLAVFMTATEGTHDVVGELVEAALRVQARHPGIAHFIMVLRSDGSAAVEERKRSYRLAIAERGIAVFDELADAAKALSALAKLEAFRMKRGLAGPQDGG